MNTRTPTLKKKFLGVLLFVALAGLTVSGQQEPPSRDDVLRINTELVQTIVTVSDKEGRFVDGLKKENFGLRVDGIKDRRK